MPNKDFWSLMFADQNVEMSSPDSDEYPDERVKLREVMYRSGLDQLVGVLPSNPTQPTKIVVAARLDRISGTPLGNPLSVRPTMPLLLPVLIPISTSWLFLDTNRSQRD
ncbi:hypothetical protein OG21DRAFT_445778 [Imleria badia]|nr:hypothetical protein OG21DRAFT_445778 [Imleria badia]